MKNPLKLLYYYFRRIIHKARQKCEFFIEKKEYDPNIVRIMFVNFWHRRCCVPNSPNSFKHWFLFPLEKVFCSYPDYPVLYETVKHYKPDIVISTTFGKRENITSIETKHKIFWSGEDLSSTASSKVYQPYNDYLLNDAELSLCMSNTINSANYLRLPYWIFYFFMPYDTRDDIRSKLSEFAQNNNRQKFCSLITRHDRKNTRTGIYNALSKIEKIDCPGLLFNNDDTLENEYHNNKRLYLKQYKFNICPENALSEGYVTEKLWEALYCGCIPIYACGNTQNPEPGIINPEIFIGFDPQNIDNATVSEIKLLNENEKLIHSWWEKPIFCDTAVDKIYEILQKYNEKMSSIAEKIISEKQAKRKVRNFCKKKN